MSRSFARQALALVGAPTAFAALAALLVFALTEPARAEVRKATGSIELPRNAAVCSPTTSHGKEYPGFAIAKLSLTSDGQKLTVAATLKNAPAPGGHTVLSLWFDTDNNATTGAKVGYPESPGWEYSAEIESCSKYADGVVCAGGSDGAVKASFAAADVDRFKSASSMDHERVVDSMGMMGHKASTQVPITAKVAQVSIDYADLKVKPGQAIRVRAQEACSSSADDGGFFPEILLTLK